MRITLKDMIKFYDKMATKWNISENSEERIEINSWFLDDILKSGMKIIDIGCGGGALSKYYAGRGMKVTGIDFSSRMIEHAKKGLKEDNPSFMVKDVVSTDNLGEYDMVMLCDVLEHVLDPLTGLLNSANMVKSDGYLFITFPHPEYRKCKGLEGQPIDQILEIGWICNLLESWEFKIVKEKGYGQDFGDYTTYYGILAKCLEKV